jgi:hypothetical protein
MKKIIIILIAIAAIAAGYNVATTTTSTDNEQYKAAAETVQKGIKYDRQSYTIFVKGEKQQKHIQKMIELAKDIAAIAPTPEIEKQAIRESFPNEPDFVAKECKRVDYERQFIFILDNGLARENPSYKEYPVKNVIFVD